MQHIEKLAKLRKQLRQADRLDWLVVQTQVLQHPDIFDVIELSNGDVEIRYSLHRYHKELDHSSTHHISRALKRLGLMMQTSRTKYISWRVKFERDMIGEIMGSISSARQPSKMMSYLLQNYPDHAYLRERDHQIEFYCNRKRLREKGVMTKVELQNWEAGLINIGFYIHSDGSRMRIWRRTADLDDSDTA